MIKDHSQDIVLKMKETSKNKALLTQAALVHNSLRQTKAWTLLSAGQLDKSSANTQCSSARAAQPEPTAPGGGAAAGLQTAALCWWVWKGLTFFLQPGGGLEEELPENLKLCPPKGLSLLVFQHPTSPECSQHHPPNFPLHLCSNGNRCHEQPGWRRALDFTQEGALLSAQLRDLPGL